MKTCQVALIAALLLVRYSPAVGEVIVVDNLAEHLDTGGSVIASTALYPYDLYTANAFTAGAGSWDILSVTVPLYGTPSDVPSPGSHRPLEIQIRNDNGGAPGSTVLGTLLDHFFDGTSTGGNNRFYPQSPLTLTGGNTYWLVGAPTGSNALYTWGATFSPVDNGVSGWSIADALYQSFDGSNFDYVGPASLKFSMTANQLAAVPEPSSLALCGLIVAAGGYARRRRKPSSTAVA